MPLSREELEDSTKADFAKARAYTVALSHPSIELLPPPLVRSLSVPATNGGDKVPLNNVEPLIDLLSEASKEDVKLSSGNHDFGKGYASCKLADTQFPDSTFPDITFQDTIFPDLDPTASTETVRLHPLNEILPLSKHSGPSIQNSPHSHKEDTKTATPKECDHSEKPAPDSIRKERIIIIIAFACMIVLCLVLIPAILLAVCGSPLSLWNYYNSLDVAAQRALVEKMNAVIILAETPYNGENTPRELIFDGIVYSPRNTMEPACGFTQQDANLDVALLSSVTSKIRTYGTQCNQAAYILNGMHQMGLNMTIMLGVWIGENSDENELQLKQAKSLLSTYPLRYFESVMIGNEALYRGDISEAKLIDAIQEMKEFLANQKLNVPVGTCEMGSFITEKLLGSLDIVGVNVLPFFTGLSVEDAAQWVGDYLATYIVPLNKKNCSLTISEVGWPYSGGSYHESIADAAIFQDFLRTWVCNTSKSLQGVDSWYYYEAFDEPWKAIFHDNDNKWETEWGVFGQYRDMKTNMSFPTC